LTDGHGRTVDFRNTIVVMTSNLGSHRIQELAGKADYQAMRAAVMEIANTAFRPEFLNRIDEVVVFHTLGREQIRAIADIQVNRLRQRLAGQDLMIEVSPAALDKLGAAGFDPVYGGRPIKRAIQSLLETPLSRRLLAGEFAPGDRIRVDVANGEFVFGR
jgi:ATP-dependent Clp protease ATP-binding subunit ClpB